MPRGRGRGQALAFHAWPILLGVLAFLGCGSKPVEEEIDAFRPRPDAFREDAFIDPAIDAHLDAPLPPGRDGGRPDAPHIDAAPDAGSVRACEGAPPPGDMPCTNDEECRARGRSRCNLPIYGLSRCSSPCFPQDMCYTDEECRGDGGTLVCNVYDPQCGCPRRVCEAPCSGPTCPTASCMRDGYRCPINSICAPDDRRADEHGCAPKPCRTSSDCDCGFCTWLGVCANGVGQCGK
ncbi:MAG: hypothetical protein NZM37_03955 [Sandaracinaceae bacterium]|nr:hypothetical protein [Sandaracinaceae bacterium]MDW8245204.1 hypothetical protein [Sandaracinaceae bacterium]